MSEVLERIKGVDANVTTSYHLLTKSTQNMLLMRLSSDWVDILGMSMFETGIKISWLFYVHSVTGILG